MITNPKDPFPTFSKLTYFSIDILTIYLSNFVNSDFYKL